MWFPLNSSKTRQQDIRTVENQKTRQGDQTRPDVPEGTVADDGKRSPAMGVVVACKKEVAR